jgi:predicted ATPase
MTQALIGRDGELAAVEGVLDRVPEGFCVLLISGPAGIGKSAIWERAVESAQERGYRVVRARPTEVETSLAFAALNDLFGDIVDDETLSGLPEPQRIALEAALLRLQTATPPQPLAAIAIRHVIQAAATQQPLILAIDDVQWLDEPTARVLDFVLRRLESEPIGLVSGSRSSADRHTVSPIDGIADERITRIDPSGLSIDALDRLLVEARARAAAAHVGATPGRECRQPVLRAGARPGPRRRASDR